MTEQARDGRNMSQFDETTERKAEESARRFPFHNEQQLGRQAFTAGRDSAKESLGILARAMEKISRGQFPPNSYETAELAIASVKARGDWPLEGE